MNTIMFIILFLFFISLISCLITNIKNNKILEKVSYILLSVFGFSLWIMLIFYNKDSTSKKEVKTETKTETNEPTMKDYTSGKADIDTVIWKHNGMADTAEVLVWKK